MTQDTQQTSDLVNKDLLGRFAEMRRMITHHPAGQMAQMISRIRIVTHVGDSLFRQPD